MKCGIPLFRCKDGGAHVKVDVWQLSYVSPALSGWDNADDLIFTQDGATPHLAINVHAWLDKDFSGQ